MMESYMNFKNFGENPQNQGTCSKPLVSTPLVRQSSVYNLTFEEFQNNLAESGKDFGSMNMDEFLKNIWTVEETQAMTTSTTVGQGSSNAHSENLQRQNSITLPRMLSQKTVDEVWRELFKENSGVKDVDPNLQQQQKQPTLGEITLEEFLFRAGVVKEDAQPMVGPDNNGYYGSGSSQPNNNMTNGFQQSAQNNLVMGNQIPENSYIVPNQPRKTPSQQPLQQPLFAKQATVNFTTSMPMINSTQPTFLGTRGPIVGIADPMPSNQSVYRSGANMSGAIGSPSRSNGDTSSASPPSYMLGGVGRGKKSGIMEKAMERRHKRMIKNRESAARSRARKQAYTFELEAEIAKLKEINHELRKKQVKNGDEILEMQNNQVTDTTKMPLGNKRRCLRRTLTGPW